MANSSFSVDRANTESIRAQAVCLSESFLAGRRFLLRDLIDAKDFEKPALLQAAADAVSADPEEKKVFHAWTSELTRLMKYASRPDHAQYHEQYQAIVGVYTTAGRKSIHIFIRGMAALFKPAVEDGSRERSRGVLPHGSFKIWIYIHKRPQGLDVWRKTGKAGRRAAAPPGFSFMLRSWMCPPDLQPEGADPPAGTGAWRQTVQVRAVDGFRYFSEGSFLPGPSLIRIWGVGSRR